MSDAQSVADARNEVETLEDTASKLRRALAESEAARNDAVRVRTLNNQSADLKAEIARLQHQLDVSTGSAVPTEVVTEEPVTPVAFDRVFASDEN